MNLGIKLSDIATGTVFTDNMTKTVYEKGDTGTFGPDGYTICFPKLGGKFQRSDRLRTKVPNDREVSLD